MNHRFLAVTAALASFALPAFAQTPLAPLAASLRAQTLQLPAQSEVVALTPADSQTPRQTYTVLRSRDAEGRWTVEWNTTRFQSRQVFRADGTLLSAELTDSFKERSLRQNSDAERTALHTVITDHGKVVSDRKASLDAGVALRDELPLLVLQSWNAGVRDGLTLKSLSPDGGMVGGFRIQFRTLSDPTSISDRYAYPLEFKAAFGAARSFLVADMSLQGIGAFFYPHHFYLVYELSGSGPVWKAYFGEDPQKPVFQYLKE